MLNTGISLILLLLKLEFIEKKFNEENTHILTSVMSSFTKMDFHRSELKILKQIDKRFLYVALKSFGYPL